jgi:hypothetical protein
MAAAKKNSSVRGKARSARGAAKASRAAKPARPVKPEAKAMPPKPTDSPKAPEAPRASKPAKTPKPVRDSFTLPAAEFEAMRNLKTRARSLGVRAKKSEILRAGLRLLRRMDDEEFAVLLAAVQGGSTGRD